MDRTVYTGCYGNEEDGQGVGVWRLDGATGALHHVQTAPVNSPSFVARHQNGRFLYAVCERDGFQGTPDGAVASFVINSHDGTLTELGKVRSHGTSACHLTVDPSGTHVIVTNYGNGRVAVFPIGANGALGEATHVVQHEGRSTHPDRQHGPHAHYVMFDPSGKYVMVCDLGLDKVLIYHLDTETGHLSPADFPYAQISSGAGPRHMDFTPDGRFAYVVNEVGSSMSAFSWDADRGALVYVDTHTTIPVDFHENTSCAQVRVHPNGHFVYGSNRGHDSIAIFGIDQATGRLIPHGQASSGGKTPRNFTLTPDGAWLLAANQGSDNIVTFHVDAKTGALTEAGHVVHTNKPVCIVVV